MPDGRQVHDLLDALYGLRFYGPLHYEERSGGVRVGIAPTASQASGDIPGRILRKDDAALLFFQRVFPMTTEPDTIDRLRATVDELDRLLVDLLNRRARLALAVSREKARLGLDVRIPAREQDVLARVQQANPGPLDQRAVTRLFRSIIAESRRLQEAARTAGEPRS